MTNTSTNVFALIFIIAIQFQHGHTFKVLGIFHKTAKSHFIAGSALMKGLANAGHEVTIISNYPQSNPIKNYRDIDISIPEDILSNSATDLLEINKMSFFKIIAQVYKYGIAITNETLHHPIIQKFLKSNDEQFDVIIMDVFVNEAFLGFGHRFNAPVIGFSAFGSSKWANDMVGSPAPLSYVPNSMLALTDHMIFIERLWNTVASLFDEIYVHWVYLPKQVEIYNSIFSDPKPSLVQLQKHVSLVLLNNHFSLNYPRPYVPNMIEVGGLQINQMAKPLSTDIQQILDNAKNGVIYFSMGSNVQSISLPLETRELILKTFSKLKQQVLWKFEINDLPDRPDNVFISNWFPQEGILAHSNVKLFITHGGLLSTTEAIYHAIPMLGIPLYGDQHLNMARTVQSGYGISVAYPNLTEQSFSWAINELLSNNRYQQQVDKVSSWFRNQPQTPLARAIYWVEYVVRHKGAKHLHSAGQDLCWFSYHNLDVFAVLFGIVIIAIGLFGFLLKTCIRLFNRINKCKIIKSNKKLN